MCLESFKNQVPFWVKTQKKWDGGFWVRVDSVNDRGVSGQRFTSLGAPGDRLINVNPGWIVQSTCQKQAPDHIKCQVSETTDRFYIRTNAGTMCQVDHVKNVGDKMFFTGIREGEMFFEYDSMHFDMKTKTTEQPLEYIVAKPADLNGLSVVQLSDKIVELQNRVEALNTNIAEIQSRAEWMSEVNGEVFDEKVYNAYRLIKAVKDQSTSDIDLAKAVANLMSKE